MGSMDWVEQYYTEQAESFGSAQITEYHQQCARTLSSIAGPSRARILDLGSGNGAIALLLARGGAALTAVELNAVDVEIARGFAASGPEDLRVVHGNFYDVELGGRYDFIYYWDGFGIGDDDDQRRLLRRIATEWLSEGGLAVIDVFCPDYWSTQSGQTYSYRSNSGETWKREIQYDPSAHRMIDVWRSQSADSGGKTRSQSLRCYTPEEFRMMVGPVGLRIVEFRTNKGEELRKENWSSCLRESTSYLVVLDLPPV